MGFFHNLENLQKINTLKRLCEAFLDAGKDQILIIEVDNSFSMAGYILHIIFVN